MNEKSFFEILKQLDRGQVSRLASTRDGKIVLAVIVVIVVAAGVYFGYDVTDILNILGQGL